MDLKSLHDKDEILLLKPNHTKLCASFDQPPVSSVSAVSLDIVREVQLIYVALEMSANNWPIITPAKGAGDTISQNLPLVAPLDTKG